ncbi:hypothetical protein ADUPG1_013080 [Aduncisulcus paluster]|uniref:Uncharacterized protein n=1 Tax=Aduncisulcus paluster TaxID=2918883 RepID=A0ABQ5K1N5_9EUKA|nr:hypothetical protein ADUPG1_013080 [Aduncisulcus paluster]
MKKGLLAELLRCQEFINGSKFESDEKIHFYLLQCFSEIEVMKRLKPEEYVGDEARILCDIADSIAKFHIELAYDKKERGESFDEDIAIYKVFFIRLRKQVDLFPKEENIFGSFLKTLEAGCAWRIEDDDKDVFLWMWDSIKRDYLDWIDTNRYMDHRNREVLMRICVEFAAEPSIASILAYKGVPAFLYEMRKETISNAPYKVCRVFFKLLNAIITTLPKLVVTIMFLVKSHLKSFADALLIKDISSPKNIQGWVDFIDSCVSFFTSEEFFSIDEKYIQYDDIVENFEIDERIDISNFPDHYEIPHETLEGGARSICIYNLSIVVIEECLEPMIGIVDRFYRREDVARNILTVINKLLGVDGIEPIILDIMVSYCREWLERFMDGATVQVVFSIFQQFAFPESNAERMCIFCDDVLQKLHILPSLSIVEISPAIAFFGNLVEMRFQTVLEKIWKPKVMASWCSKILDWDIAAEVERRRRIELDEGYEADLEELADTLQSDFLMCVRNFSSTLCVELLNKIKIYQEECQMTLKGKEEEDAADYKDLRANLKYMKTIEKDIYSMVEQLHKKYGHKSEFTTECFEEFIQMEAP